MLQLKRSFLVGLICVFPVLAGCGNSGSVSGKIESVNYKTGKAQNLVAGKVIFLDATNNEKAEGLIASDGTYTVPEIAPGTYKVVVAPLFVQEKNSEEFAKVDTDGANEQLPQGVTKAMLFPIHGKYRSVARTPLTFEAKTGTQTFDISIKEPWVYERPTSDDPDNTNVDVDL